MTTTSDELAIQVLRGGDVVGEEPLGTGACTEDALYRGVVAGSIANDGQVPDFALEPRHAPNIVGTASGEGSTSSGKPESGDSADPESVTELVLHPGAMPGRFEDPLVYPREVFAALARAITLSLRAGPRLCADDHVSWRIVARAPSQRLGAGFRTRVTRRPYPFDSRPLPDVPPGSDHVEVDAGVLDELRARVITGGAVEVAGLLLGKLERDPERRAARVRVTATLPLEAGRDGASESHFSFDPLSFGAARRRAAERSDGSQPVGWIHSHPACAECPSNAGCRSETLFFSSSDVEVHASAFSSPFMVALVAGKASDRTARDPVFRLYGWQGARVVERRLAVTGAGAAAWRPRILEPVDSERDSGGTNA